MMSQRLEIKEHVVHVGPSQHLEQSKQQDLSMMILMKIFLNKKWLTVSILPLDQDQVLRMVAVGDGCTMSITICFKIIEELKLKFN